MTAKAAPSTSPSAMQRSTTVSDSFRSKSQSRKGPCLFLEKVEWSGTSPSRPSRQNKRYARFRCTTSQWPTGSIRTSSSGLIEGRPVQLWRQMATDRQSDRSTSASSWRERAAQVRTRRTAPPDRPAADPSSIQISTPTEEMNQRSSSASTGWVNTIRQKRLYVNDLNMSRLGLPHLYRSPDDGFDVNCEETRARASWSPRCA